MRSKYMLYADRTSARFAMRKEGEAAVAVFTSLHDAISHICSQSHAEGGEMVLHSAAGRALTRLPLKRLRTV